MYRFNWTKSFTNNYIEVIEHIKQIKPQVVAIDTETTGLNITNDTPFLLVVAFLTNECNGISYVLEYDLKDTKKLLTTIVETATYIVGANIKYDLHILKNGGSEFPFAKLNDNHQLTDIRILRRLTYKADDDNQKMSLKYLGKILIDDNANNNELEIDVALKQIRTQHRAILNTMLKPYKSSAAKIKKELEDFHIGIENIQPNVLNAYNEWLNTYGEGNYYDIYKQYPEMMQQYAIQDGILTIELFYLLYDELMKDAKYNQDILKIFKQENDLIPIYYKQEIIGVSVDINYLKESKRKLIEYIRGLEQELYNALLEPISENQHKELIRVLQQKFNVEKKYFIDNNKECFNKAVVRRLKKHPDNHIVLIAKLIETLRTTKKWLKTYIMGMLEQVIENKDNKLHPQNDQVGTVSGRISSPFQQVPKNAIYDSNNNELYHPRKAIIPSQNGYSWLVFQDFDQMELRVQADYTILFNCLDVSMCSMFVPLNCTYNGIVYDVNDEWCKEYYNSVDINNQSIWLDNITFQPWTKIDPHGLLVKIAFDIDENNPNWKHYRSAAKTINFAMTYGSGLKSLLENPSLEDYSQEIITSIYNAYKKNYPGVVNYQKQVISYVQRNGSIVNRYGRNYKINDLDKSFKACNYLIQGTCADLVKSIIIEIDKFIVKHKCKSRLLHTIHDEIFWEMYNGEEYLIEEFKKIVKQQSSWSKIPLTCGTDLSYTNWAEKKDISEYTKN